MGKRLLDYNPLTGVSVTFEFDHANNNIVIGHSQDTEKVLESNKWALLDLDKHKKQAKEGRMAHYAKIPELVIMEWKFKYGVDFYDPNHWPKVMELLNDPEYKYLKRTSYKHDR